MSLHEGSADSPQQPGYVAAAGQVTFVFCPTDVGFESSVGTGFASDLLPKASRGEPRGRNALSLLGDSGVVVVILRLLFFWPEFKFPLSLSS